MHRHILINHDLDLHITVFSTSPDLELDALIGVIDDMIMETLCNAAKGIQKAGS